MIYSKAMEDCTNAIDREFSLSSVEVFKEHIIGVQSIQISLDFGGNKKIYHYNTLPVKPGIYPVSTGPSRYDESTMEILCLSPLDAYGLQSLGKAKVTKAWEE